MLILAYQFMMKECPLECVERVMEVFGRTALEVCEGQQWDMEFEHRLDVTVDEYIEMICLKTSVLLAAALKIGAILGGAPEKDAQLLYDLALRWDWLSSCRMITWMCMVIRLSLERRLEEIFFAIRRPLC